VMGSLKRDLGNRGRNLGKTQTSGEPKMGSLGLKRPTNFRHEEPGQPKRKTRGKPNRKTGQIQPRNRTTNTKTRGNPQKEIPGENKPTGGKLNQPHIREN